MDYNKAALEMHKKNKGKIEVISKVEIENKDDLSTAYSPGVAAPCLEIANNEEEYKTYTSAASTVAVISDGSAVLGLGDIGPKAAMPVMEGKSALFKKFGGVNSYPLVIDTQDVEEFITTVKHLAPSFGGINLEDISAPRCFEIEERLKKELPIPVFHDDQHGTAIVTLAGIMNYLKLSGKEKDSIKIIINGSGAAGGAIAKLLKYYGIKNIILCDRTGAISKSRSKLSPSKQMMADDFNPENISGTLHEVIKGADIFIGVSSGNILGEEDIKNMNKNPAVFAMANPIPEIMPDIAKKGGALVVGTGRSDFENQLNNVLVFPGIFKGALECGARDITEDMKIAAAKGLASLVETPTPQKIIPNPFEQGVAAAVASAVKNEFKKTNKIK
ncbi:MAG: NADP-dependent malic enzyme [Nanoarchaeota archaeon]|nr:NADP-dependent malic enzyme [Nanoarchaeota archaeon]